jgi:mono/diheme cytochrome c family protein
MEYPAHHLAKLSMIFFRHSLMFLCFGLAACEHLASCHRAFAQESTDQVPSSATAPDADPLDQELSNAWRDEIKPLLVRHCGECHMGDADEGGVALNDYDSLSKIRDHENTWEQIRGVIRAEAMPPPESAEITAQERATLTQWIERALHEVDCGCRPPVPPVTLRRLNQTEYDTTIRDLIGLDVRPSKAIGFVSDDVGNGFDNQGEVLTLAPIALEKYMQAAAFVAEKAIASDREQFRKQSFEPDSLAYRERIEVPVFVSQGKYMVNVRARFGDDQKDNCKARLLWDGQSIVEWDVPPKNEIFKQEIETAAGDHLLAIEYLDDSDPDTRNAPNRRLIVESFRMSGPDEGDPAFPKVHEQIVVAYPDDRDSPDGPAIGQLEASRRVISRFLPRAYRRAVTEQEIDAVVTVCQRGWDEGFSYLESLRYGLQAALVSPQFLFREESYRVLPNGQRCIDDYSLASRLSYFLWSSIPDEELMRLASRGELNQETNLRAQIQRMLDDPKSDALLTGFFAQWLGLRNLNKIDVDENKFPAWSERLRDAMIRETELFCRALLREGKISDLLNADYTFVNPRLAEYYGIEFEGQDPAQMYRRRPGKKGNDERRLGLYDEENKWIRVALPTHRRGIVTQAASLALTSNPTRSSPVKRGRWILETLLGDPPPTAPPNIPSLEQAKAAEQATLRERLEVHRSNPSCAGCHKLMDPIGLGLENFDAIGRWRDADGGQPIASQGELVDGRTFDGPVELVAILAQRQDAIARNLTQRMLTYALGRGLQRADRCDVDTILERSRAQQYTMRSIVEGIVLSDAFLQRSISPIPDPLSRSEPADEPTRP